MRDLHELLMNASVMVIIRRGAKLQVELLNACAQHALGGRDLRGRTLPEVFPELEAWLGKIDAAVRTGQHHVGVDESVAIDWSGTGEIEARYLTLVCQPILDRAGAFDGNVMFAIDVTTRVLPSARRQRDSAWIEAALDSVATPVVLAQPGTRRILFANAAARELSRGDLPGGTTFGQAIGLDAGFFCTDAAGSRMPEDQMPASRASRGEVVDAMDLLWHTPFGVIPLVCFAELVPSSEALPPVVVLSFFDVAHVKRLEREVLEVEAVRDEFLYLAGHELRTPLTALKLQVQSLVRRYPEASGLAAIERATGRMEALVDQLLDAVRIREVGVRLEPRELDLCVVVDHVIRRFESEARRVGSSLARVGVPALRGSWDPIRLEHVMTNLVSNALRFGAGTPIVIECGDLGGRVSVAVTDAGMGIDPVDHDRVFQRFSRAASWRHFGGLGLGLWLTREIVTQMGGSIGVKSSLGQGATFTLELPKLSQPGRDSIALATHKPAT